MGRESTKSQLSSSRHSGNFHTINKAKFIEKFVLLVGLKENGYDNGYGGSYNRGATQMQPIETKVQLGAGVGAGAAAVGATAAYDARYQS